MISSRLIRNLIILLLGFHSVVRSQNSFHVEEAPLYYLYSGFSFDASYRIPNSNLSIGINTARMNNFPGFAKGFFHTSDNLSDLDISWELAVGLQSKYHFKNTPGGLYVGIILAYEEWKISAENNEIDTKNNFIALAPGYIWYPIKGKNYTLNFQLLIVHNFNHSGGNSVNDIKFKLRDFALIGNVLLGYHF